MENQTKHAQPTSGRSSRWSMLIRLYQKWRTWQLKVQTRRSLLRMSDERLKDIGLTRDDIDRL